MTTNTVRSYMKSQYPGHQQAYMSEFFAYFETLTTDSARVKALKLFMSECATSMMKVTSFRNFLDCYFSDEWKLDLPEGIPSGIKMHTQPDQVQGSMWKTMGSIAYFIPATDMFIQQSIKREKIFLAKLS